jgi:hypothetical protein
LRQPHNDVPIHIDIRINLTYFEWPFEVVLIVVGIGGKVLKYLRHEGLGREDNDGLRAIFVVFLIPAFLRDLIRNHF